MRASGVVSIQTGDAVAARWQAVPIPARAAAYGHSPPPSTVIPEASGFDITPDHANFAVLRLTLDQIELVDLSDPDEADHRRALFTRHDNWRGQWRSP